jgi:lipopolysaccharide/colanic/teichoic acid biosynthesis glycosyltransferase
VALIAQSLVAYALRDFILPHLLMLYGSAFSLVALFLWRLLYSTVLLQSVGREKILLVGSNATVREIVEEIESDPSSVFEIAGYLDDSPVADSGMGRVPVLGSVASLRKVVAERKPGRIVVGLIERRDAMPVQDLLEMRFAGCRIEEAGVTYEMVYKRICSRDLSPTRVVFLRELTPPVNSLWFSQSVSRVLAALLLIVLSPVLLVVALALMVRSRQSPFTRLPRLGKAGRPFQLLRFRDSQILGPLYRRLRVAALPGLFNVLKGDMVLVGPRPASMERAQRISAEMPLYDYRHNVRPGMTGWAQINSGGPKEDEHIRELEYDLYYIKHMSQALNMYILLNTFKNRVLRVESPTA